MLPASDKDTVTADGGRENLLGKPETALARFFDGLGEKPFRARQVLQWIHQRHVTRFDEMTDLSKALRTRLEEIATVSLPEVIAQLSTLFTLKSGDLIFTGTPAGVGPVGPGDQLLGQIEGLEDLSITLVARP